MAEYVTEQKTLLLDFLEKNSGSAYTIDELMEKMSAEGGESIPAKSTVYRLMGKLVDEGRVKKFAKDGCRGFVYQAFLGEHCAEHLHMKCISCGRLLHLDHELSGELLDKIKNISSFDVSESDTVLFGSCADCKSGEGVAKNEK